MSGEPRGQHLWMPLNGQQKRILPRLEPLHDAVVAEGRSRQGLRDRRDGLMMEAVDFQSADAHASSQETALRNRDGMCDPERAEHPPMVPRGTCEIGL